MIVLDIEADDLKATKIWCVCCYEPATDSFKIFHEDSKATCKAYLESQDTIIAHNGICFDFPVLERLWGITIPIKNIYDTLVASRLSDPKRESGHSLKEWGIKLGVFKDHYEDWTHWSQEMEDYCCQDCKVCWAVFNAVKKELVGFSPISVQIEMRCQYLLSKMHWGGFPLNIQAAMDLKNRCDQEYLQLIQKIQQAFPPRKNLIGQYKARRKKDGSLTAKSAEIIMRPLVEPTETPDLYNVYEEKEFLIDSPSEIRERLAPYWHPTVMNKPTKDGTVTAKVCPENLETVSDDAPEEIKDIVRCKILKSRATLIQSFLDACWEDDRVHGDIISVGAASNRMAHRNPNTANIPSGKSLYGEECRALFKAPEGKVLVGCDLAGIQLRALAHYVKDQALVDQITGGDIHVHLAKIYGLIPPDATPEETKKGRTRGKTITYAILMGAGASKIGLLAGGDVKLGRDIMNRLSQGIHGWSKLKATIDIRAKKGYFKALDGRQIKLSNAHLGMSYYLQSFETCIIKWAMWEAFKRFKKAGLTVEWHAVVHDEVQLSCNKEDAEQVGQIVRDCYKAAGEFYHSFCPLDGEYIIGGNWKETH